MPTEPEVISRKEDDLPEKSPAVLYDGKFLTFKRKGSWEYVERRNVTGTVAILAIKPNPSRAMSIKFGVRVWCVSMSMNSKPFVFNNK